MLLLMEGLWLLNTGFHFSHHSSKEGWIVVCAYIQTIKEFLISRHQNDNRLTEGLHCEMSALLRFTKYPYVNLWYLLGTLSFFFIQHKSTFKVLRKSVIFHLTGHLLTHSHMTGVL